MRSATFGEVSIEQMTKHIHDYVNKDTNKQYVITVGTDSQKHDLTKVVLVVAIHTVGYGGIFFYDIKHVDNIKSLQQKIYFETSLTLELAMELTKRFAEENIQQKIGVHVDIGDDPVKCKTSSLVKEIVGWVTSSGFECFIKPNAYTASCIADKISK